MQRITACQLDAIAKWLHEADCFVAAYCFGSQMRRDCPAPGDVDIAVLGCERLTLDELLSLQCDWSLLLGTDRLDVVDLRAAGPVLKRNVVTHESRFYCRDEHAANEFELLALAEYRDSDYRRRLETQMLRASVTGP